MAFDGILAGILARQLNERLSGAKIEKVQQPSSEQIILQVHEQSGQRTKLLLDVSSQGSRFHMTNLPYDNPEDAPKFCMFLRKHLSGGRILSITQPETERIIIINISTVNEMGYSINKNLILETMGKHSNLVLTDAESGKIIDSIKRISIDVNSVRQVLPGLIYVFPPKQDKLDFWSLKEDASYDSVQGFSPKLINQVSKSPLELLQDIQSENYSYSVYMDGDKPVDFHALLLEEYAKNLKKIDFENLNDCLDFYYSHKLETSKVLQRNLDLEKQVQGLINKLNTKKAKLLDEIRQADEADIFRIKAEILNANLHLVKPGEKSVKLISYYDGSEIEIQLDVKLSPAKNAQSYYKKYSKLKSSKKEKLSQLSECEEDIKYLESILGLIPGCKTGEEIESVRSELLDGGYIRARKASDKTRKKNAKPKPRSFDLEDGFKVLVGRNNIENDYITFKVGQKNDWWFHTKGIHGSHTVLICQGKDPGEKIMHKAASIAAWYSKGQQSDNVEVDYCQLKYVKKPTGSKPGKVIFTNNGTIYSPPIDPNK